MKRFYRAALPVLCTGTCLLLVLHTMVWEKWSDQVYALGSRAYPALSGNLVEGFSDNEISLNEVVTNQPQLLESPATPKISENFAKTFSKVESTTTLRDTPVRKSQKAPQTATDLPQKTQASQVRQVLGPELSINPLTTFQPTAETHVQLENHPVGGDSLPLAISHRIGQKPHRRRVLSPAKLLQIMGSEIGEFPVQDPRRVVRVIVAGYFRSGSSFLGDILRQNQKTFFYFEPLHSMTVGQRIKEDQVAGALSLLNSVFKCNYSSPLAIESLWWKASRYRNPFLWEACPKKRELCFRPDFVRFVCVRAPWQVMKVNRLSLEQVGKFVLDNPDLDVRVLHLVRDPRGIISSRKPLGWCNTTGCTDSRVLCNQMNSDHETFVKLRKLKPDRFFQLRYEDLSLNPEPVTKEMFGSLGLPYTSSVATFLELNTKASLNTKFSEGTFSTRRDSSRTPFEWRKKLKLEEIKEIQKGCSSVLQNYEYTMVNSSQELTTDPRNLYSGEKPWLRT